MKNVLVIDGAANASFSVCLMDDADFAVVFPAAGQDVEFIEDVTARVGEGLAADVIRRGTTRRIYKRQAVGIDGTLFVGLPERRRYFPNKREDDVDGHLLARHTHE